MRDSELRDSESVTLLGDIKDTGSERELLHIERRLGERELDGRRRLALKRLAKRRRELTLGRSVPPSPAM
jgi:hypothetical protein